MDLFSMLVYSERGSIGQNNVIIDNMKSRAHGLQTNVSVRRHSRHQKWVRDSERIYMRGTMASIDSDQANEFLYI